MELELFKCNANPTIQCVMDVVRKENAYETFSKFTVLENKLDSGRISDRVDKLNAMEVAIYETLYKVTSCEALEAKHDVLKITIRRYFDICAKMARKVSPSVQKYIYTFKRIDGRSS